MIYHSNKNDFEVKYITKTVLIIHFYESWFTTNISDYSLYINIQNILF